MAMRMIIWVVITLSLAHTFEGTPADPQKFTFLSGNPQKPNIAENYGCFPPNETSTKYTFTFESDEWVLYVLCYDKISSTPLQSMHQLSPPVSEHTLNIPYSTNKFSKFLIATPSVFYQCSSQVENFKNSLGSESHVRTLINCNNGFHLTPSNLVPASDFPFEQQRIASQEYINTFPQWKEIKDGNWKSLERSIRKYANDINSPLMIKGGTLGVATLPDSAGQHQPLYMTKNTIDMDTVAVPRLVWKVVYDHANFKSIVFVVVNNPYRTSTQDLFKYGEVVCNCVCNQTEGWFDGWNRLDFTKGYIYCCTWDEFNRNVGVRHVPSTKLLRQKK